MGCGKNANEFFTLECMDKGSRKEPADHHTSRFQLRMQASTLNAQLELGNMIFVFMTK